MILTSRWLRQWLFACCILLILPLSLQAAPRGNARQRATLVRTGRYARDHVIVKYKGLVAHSAQKSLEAQVGGTVTRRFRSSGAVLLKLKKGRDADTVIGQLKNNPNVEYVERDHYLSIHRTIPNDPDFESQWGLENVGQMLGTDDADIDAPEAWDIETGSSDVIVAVIDTGVDYDHDDLRANMWVNPNEIADNGVDDDNNGFVDDVYGVAILNGVGDGDPWDDHGHGTHVAGIIGAVGNNNRGVTGVCWTVRIMALKFLDASGYGLESDAAACIDYAVAHGAKITNNSYGGPDHSETLLQAIQNASAAGVLYCTSSGNEGLDLDVTPSYPASYDVANVISIASTGGSDNISYFSNYGRNSVHVGAPGESIWSTYTGNEYQLLDGTSMACPFVAGIAALVLSHEPTLSMADLRERVVWTGDRTFDLQETTITGLRVNAYNALMGVYSVRINTQSPLPDATVDTAYSTLMDATGFHPPYIWTWSAPQYVEQEVANGFTWSGVGQYWQSDNAMWELTIPFSFPFYGQNYSTVYVSSNGYLEFAASMPTSEDISDVTLLAQKKAIAVYWSDLTTSDDWGDLDIYVWQPDANSIGIRWQAEEADWLLGMPINMSVVLHANGEIEMHYGRENFSLVGGVVGISAGDGTNYRLSTLKTNNLQLGWAPTSLWTSGALPPGLQLDVNTGEINGTPTQAGLYTFDVRAEDQSGGSDTRAFTMKVFPATGPRADFTANPLLGMASLQVSFTDESTSTQGVTAWLWNFGDGQSSTSTNPVHTYNDPGIYTVALTVTAPDGSDTATKIRYIEAFKPGPIVDFYAEPQVGNAPLTVIFTDLSEPSDPYDMDAELAIWTWDFGDGSPQYMTFDDLPFDYTYYTPGVFDVTLVVDDWTGARGMEKKFTYITVVGEGPQLGVSVTPATFDFGFLEPGATATNAGSPLVIRNTGGVNEQIGLRIRDEDNWNAWVSSPFATSANTYILSARVAATIGTFSWLIDALGTTVTWCDGDFYFGGGGASMAPDATENLWFKFEAPTSVTGATAAKEHTITAEVSCQAAQ